MGRPDAVATASGEWAVILGVTGGSGSAIARALARSPGLHVFGVHRGNWQDAARAVHADVTSAGKRAHLHVADAGTADGAASGARAILDEIGPGKIKMFVHAIANASVGRLLSGGDRRIDARRIEKTFNSMAHSFVYWAQALVDANLLAPEARLLGLSNPMDDVVVGGTAAIAATKAALGAYVRHLAHELGPVGHRVNLLKFGAMTTHAVGKTFGATGVDRLRQVVEAATPARRLCRPDEIGQFVSVLAGEAGAWFNGATIDFTGGEFQGLMNVLLSGEANMSAKQRQQSSTVIFRGAGKAPKDIQLHEPKLASLRKEFSKVNGEPDEATSLAEITAALANGTNTALGLGIYHALMSGLDVPGLVKVAVPVIVGYVGANGVTRFNTLLDMTVGLLEAAQDEKPAAIEAAIAAHIVTKQFLPDLTFASHAGTLTAEEIQALKDGYNDNRFSDEGAKKVTGRSTDLGPYIEFVNHRVYDGRSLNADLRELMILAALAGRGDLTSTAIHCYSAICVGIPVDKIRTVLAGVGGQRAKEALAVFGEVLSLLKIASDKSQTKLEDVIQVLGSRFFSLQAA